MPHTEEQRRRHAERQRAWYAANKERVKEICRRSNEKYADARKAHQAAYRAAHKEEIAEKYRIWREQNPEKAKASYTNYRKENPDKYKASCENWRQNNRQRHLAGHRERSRRYYETHKDIHRSRVVQWGRENPTVLKQYYQRYRALKNKATVESVDLQAILERDNGICGICGKPVIEQVLEFDHIVPLSRGGGHTNDNLQCAHKRCNRRKGAKLPEELDPACFVTGYLSA